MDGNGVIDMKRVGIFSALLFLFLFAVNVSATEITVCPSGCDSTTIQDAVNLASSGDTVVVSAGTYSESIAIDKPLILLGAKSNVDSRNGAWGSEDITTINAGEGNNGILITSSDVTVNGFKIIESGSDAEVFSLDYPFESAIYIYNESLELENIHIIYNWIDDNYGAGIIIRYVKEPIVEYNYISNNGAGVWASAGIGGQELTNGSFSYNEITNSISYGMYFGGGKVGSLPKNTTGVLVSNNDFHDNEKYGLQLYGYYEPTSVFNSGVRLENNTFHDNGRCGIKVTDFTDTLIADNEFENNGANGTSDKYKYGALISAYYTASGTQVIHNTFSDNEIGGVYFLLELADAYLSDINVTQNKFLDAGAGVVTASRGAFPFPFVINAEGNWWGSATPDESKFIGNISHYPHAINAECSCSITTICEEFDGNDTTDFSVIEDWENVDLVLDVTDGLINWTSAINLSTSALTFTVDVVITHNRINIDTGDMPELNEPATLMFKNSGYTRTNDFLIKRNGVNCHSDICNNIRMEGNSVIVDVNQMSDYSLEDAIIDPASITGQLVLSVGFGIMGIMSILVLLELGYGSIEPKTWIKIFVSILIVILMLVGVWQGLVL
jgi:parallel beta-helix repeat protein